MKQILYFLLYLCYYAECIIGFSDINIKKIPEGESNAHCLIQTKIEIAKVVCEKCQLSKMSGSYELSTEGLQRITLIANSSTTKMQIPLIINCNSHTLYSDRIRDFTMNISDNFIEIKFEGNVEYGFIIVYTDGANILNKIVKHASERYLLELMTVNQTHDVCIAAITENGEGFKYRCREIKSIYPMLDICKNPPKLIYLKTKQFNDRQMNIKWNISTIVDCQISELHIKFYETKSLECLQNFVLLSKQIHHKIQNRIAKTCDKTTYINKQNVYNGDQNFEKPLSPTELQIFVVMADGNTHKINAADTSFTNDNLDNLAYGNEGNPEKNVFEDCELKNGDYYGIRSFTKSGEVCKKWPKNKYNIKHNGCSNPDKSAHAWCFVEGKKTNCGIPKCKNKDGGYFVKIISIKISSKLISMRWYHEKNDLMGYIVLLYDYKKYCLESAIYYVGNTIDDSSLVKSFLKLCDYPHYIYSNDNVLRHNFLELLPDTQYHIYIMAMLDKNQISLVRHLNPRTIQEEENTFEDCEHGYGIYNGIRSADKSGKKCDKWSNYKQFQNPLYKSNFCRNPDASDHSWCYRNEKRYSCDIPVCNYKEKYVEHVSISSTGSSISITWKDQNSDWIGYVLLLHNQEEACVGNVVYKRNESHIEFSIQVRNLYISCNKTRLHSMPWLHLRYDFTGLNSDTLYNAYIIPIIDTNRIGKVRRLQQKTKTLRTIFEDCKLDDGSYFGIRSLTKSNQSCDAWVNYKYKKYNVLSKRCSNPDNSSSPWCVKNRREKEDCDIPVCQNIGHYIEYVSTSSTASSVTVKWPYQETEWIGYLLLLLDENSNCTTSVFVSDTEEQKYKNEVLHFSAPCNNVRFQKLNKIQLKYVFTGLKPDTVYNILAVPFSKDKADFVTARQQKTKINKNTFEDCQLDDGSYYGIRSVTKNNQPCDEWSKRYPYGETNMCRNPDMSKNAWCYVQQMKVYCDIPKCTNQDENYVNSVSIDSFSNYISITWKHENERWIGYIVMIHNYKNKCISAVTYSKKKNIAQSNYVKNLRGACRMSYYNMPHTSELKHSFDGLKTYIQYLIYIIPIIEFDKIGLVKIFYQRTKKNENVFEDCQLEDGSYDGIRSVGEHGFVCDHWSEYKTYSNFNLKSNRCANLGISDNVWCLHSDKEITCDVPKCKNTTISAKDVSTSYSKRTITISWKRTRYWIGWLLLLHNEKGECVQVIHSSNKKISYTMRVFNFYLSCTQSKQIKSTEVEVKYQFSDLEINKLYKMYVIPIIKKDEVGLVTMVSQMTSAVEDHKITIFEYVSMVLVLIFGFLIIIGICTRDCWENQSTLRNRKSGESLKTIPKFDRKASHDVPIKDAKNPKLFSTKFSKFVLAPEYQNLNGESKLMAKYVNLDAENKMKDHEKFLTGFNKPGEKKLNISIIPFINNSEQIEYLASEAPYHNKREEFAEIIWKNKINCIIMLLQDSEFPNIKSDLYYPNQNNQSIKLNDKISVQLKFKDDRNGLVERHLLLSNKDSNDSRLILHIQMPNWNVNALPELKEIDEIITMLHQPHSINITPPILVHCSDGLGRTGTLIALDRIIRQAKQSVDSVNIYNTVLTLRMQRPKMVINENQYMFLYQYLSYYLTSKMKTL